MCVRLDPEEGDIRKLLHHFKLLQRLAYMHHGGGFDLVNDEVHAPHLTRCGCVGRTEQRIRRSEVSERLFIGLTGGEDLTCHLDQIGKARRHLALAQMGIDVVLRQAEQRLGRLTCAIDLQGRIDHENGHRRGIKDRLEFTPSRIELGRVHLKLFVDGDQLFVGRLEFFVGGLKLFVGRLKLFVGRLKLLVDRLKLLVRGLQFLDGLLQGLARGRDIDLKLADPFGARILDQVGVNVCRFLFR